MFNLLFIVTKTHGTIVLKEKGLISSLGLVFHQKRYASDTSNQGVDRDELIVYLQV